MAQKLKFTEKVPISSHLIELKNRMIKVAIVLAFFFGLCFYFKDFLLLWLEDPSPSQIQGQPYFHQPDGTFFRTYEGVLHGSSFYFHALYFVPCLVFYLAGAQG